MEQKGRVLPILLWIKHFFALPLSMIFNMLNLICLVPVDWVDALVLYCQFVYK